MSCELVVTWQVGRVLVEVFRVLVTTWAASLDKSRTVQAGLGGAAGLGDRIIQASLPSNPPGL